VIGDRNSTAFSMSRRRRTVAFMRDAADRRPRCTWPRSPTRGRATDVRQLTHANDALVAGSR
jgi:hypothetical protein